MEKSITFLETHGKYSEKVIRETIPFAVASKKYLNKGNRENERVAILKERGT